MSDERTFSEVNEPWTYKRLRYRLTMLAEVMDLVRPADESSRQVLSNIKADLIEARAGLDQWYGSGIFK